jgi:hypothetical protein
MQEGSYLIESTAIVTPQSSIFTEKGLYSAKWLADVSVVKAVLRIFTVSQSPPSDCDRTPQRSLTFCLRIVLLTV